MQSSRPAQSLSFRGRNPVRSGGDPMWIAAGKPILRHGEAPTIDSVIAGVGQDNSAWMASATHPEASGIATAVSTVPASASTADRRAYSVEKRWPPCPHSPMIQNLFPTQRSRYALA